MIPVSTAQNPAKAYWTMGWVTKLSMRQLSAIRRVWTRTVVRVSSQARACSPARGWTS